MEVCVVYKLGSLKFNLTKSKLILSFFIFLFFISLLFCGYSVFASAEKFKIADVEIIDKSDNVLHSIDDFNDEEVIDNITFYKLK